MQDAKSKDERAAFMIFLFFSDFARSIAGISLVPLKIRKKKEGKKGKGIMLDKQTTYRNEKSHKFKLNLLKLPRYNYKVRNFQAVQGRSRYIFQVENLIILKIELKFEKRINAKRLK